jgi:hypothetical protein
MMTARMWGARPSQLLSLRDDVTAFALDEALALRSLVEREVPPAQLPAGQRYERPSDVPRRGRVVPGPYAHLVSHA